MIHPACQPIAFPGYGECCYAVVVLYFPVAVVMPYRHFVRNTSLVKITVNSFINLDPTYE